MDTHSRYQSVSTQRTPGVSWALGPHPESAPWRCPPGAHSTGGTQQGRGEEGIPGRRSGKDQARGKGMLPVLVTASAQGQERGEAEELAQEPHTASWAEATHSIPAGGTCSSDRRAPPHLYSGRPLPVMAG